MELKTKFLRVALSSDKKNSEILGSFLVKTVDIIR
jgi:hypothetical protein